MHNFVVKNKKNKMLILMKNKNFLKKLARQEDWGFLEPFEPIAKFISGSKNKVKGQLA